MIVTDHHLPETELPPAVAVLNPNRPDCAYPDKDLCGAGVAFKLAQALLARSVGPTARLRRMPESLLKMVAIATVADVVPLTGENRVIVKHGLDGLREVRNPGLRALLDVAGFTDGTVPSARQVAFQIAPRLNAAGRMDTAKTVIEMFLTADAAQRARAGRSSSTIRTPSGTRCRPRFASSASRSTCADTATRRWCITPTTGIAACWALWPAAWWSAGIGRYSCWG